MGFPGRLLSDGEYVVVHRLRHDARSELVPAYAFRGEVGEDGTGGLRLDHRC